MKNEESIYLVEIQEVLRRTVAIPASSHVSALDKVRKAYDSEKIVLSADDCVHEETVLTAMNESVSLVDIPSHVYLLEVNP